MTHYSEEDLVLHYYGEDRRREVDVDRHLEACAACAAIYRGIEGTLAMISAPEVPERGDQYGLGVWQLAVILHGPGCLLVAIQAQVPDLGRRNQIQDRIDHSQPGSQDRHQAHTLAESLSDHPR